MVTIRYPGFLQQVVREFPTRERAIQWLRQAGLDEPWFNVTIEETP